MSIYVKSGSALTYIQSVLNDHTDSYQKSMERLSSGNKYASVGENPVNVCTSAKLQVKIDSNSQALDNVNLGQDMLSMTEGYQTEIMSNIQRIRDLSLQAANGTYDDANKDAILSEIRARLTYIDKISTSANFNGVGLLDGSSSNIFLQIGPNSDATIDIGDALIDTHTTALGIDLPPTITGANWTPTDITNYLDSLDTATDTLLDSRVQIAGYSSRLEAVSQSLTTMNDNMIQNKSAITDTDTAKECADMVRYQIMQEATASILVQANQASSLALQLLHK